MWPQAATFSKVSRHIYLLQVALPCALPQQLTLKRKTKGLAMELSIYSSPSTMVSLQIGNGWDVVQGACKCRLRSSGDTNPRASQRMKSAAYQMGGNRAGSANGDESSRNRLGKNRSFQGLEVGLAKLFSSLHHQASECDLQSTGFASVTVWSQISHTIIDGQYFNVLGVSFMA